MVQQLPHLFAPHGLVDRFFVDFITGQIEFIPARLQSSHFCLEENPTQSNQTPDNSSLLDDSQCRRA